MIPNFLQQPYDLDNIDDYQVFLDSEHHKIHEGVHYACQDYDNEVDVAAPKYWRITTPNTSTRIHAVFCVLSSFPGLVEFFENPTITGAGTGLTIYNNDRNSANTATATCFKDTTVSSDGTRIGVNVMGSDPATPGVGVASTAGGILDRRDEAILKQNEDYIVKFTPALNNARVSNCFRFYEV